MACWSKAVYPFHWLAHWPLLAMALQQNQLPDAVVAARAMLDPGQQQLPTEVEDLLSSAVYAWGANNETVAQSHLESTAQLASLYGYL